MMKGVVAGHSNKPIRILHSFSVFLFLFSLSKSMGEIDNTEACLRMRCDRFIRITAAVQKFHLHERSEVPNIRNGAYEIFWIYNRYLFTCSEHMKCSAVAPNPSRLRLEALKKKEKEDQS